MNSQHLKKLNLPDSPGVYLFKKNKHVLYIGKATSLKDRVKSYFSKDLFAARGPLLVDMVFQADKVDFVPTDSVLEALLLEAELIRKYQPKYNTKEKDDKSWNFVAITKEDFPKISVVRGRNLENYKNLQASFGPFTSGGELKEALKIIRKIFPFLEEKKTGYSFYREIGLAPDVAGEEAKRKYGRNIKNIKLFFEGKKKSIMGNLEKEMKMYAKRREFEKADEIKKTLFALNHIQDIALLKVENKQSKVRIEAYDVAHISGTNTVGAMVVIENGIPDKNEYRKFKIRKSGQNDIAGLEEILSRRFNHPEWRMPDIVAVDGGIAQKNAAERVLRKMGVKAVVVAVTKNERHKPETMQGRADAVDAYKKEILLANSEAHRFAIGYHRKLRKNV